MDQNEEPGELPLLSAGQQLREAREAQKLSIETLRNMRYQDLYFVIVDQDQRLLLQPTSTW